MVDVGGCSAQAPDRLDVFDAEYDRGKSLLDAATKQDGNAKEQWVFLAWSRADRHQDKGDAGRCWGASSKYHRQ